MKVRAVKTATIRRIALICLLCMSVGTLTGAIAYFTIGELNRASLESRPEIENWISPYYGVLTQAIWIGVGMSIATALISWCFFELQLRHKDRES